MSSSPNISFEVEYVHEPGTRVSSAGLETTELYQSSFLFFLETRVSTACAKHLAFYMSTRIQISILKIVQYILLVAEQSL